MKKIITLLSNSTSISLVNSIITSLAVLFFSTAQAAAEYPRHNPVPGGVAIIDLEWAEKMPPKVYFKKRRVMLRKQSDTWQAIIGIPLLTKPGTHKLVIKNGQTKSLFRFKVKNKDYETRHITIPNERMVSPGKKDLERHFKEKPLIIAALKTWTDQAEVSSSFIVPVQGRLSSQFGLKRIYNKQARIRRHTGLDIAAPNGTPIVAPAKGKIIRTGNYFFTGGTVFLDHGQGLITMYCHLSKINVKAGDVLQQGDRIGDVGSTGRVSGPHLHWVVSLNNTKVEPKLFIDLPELQAKK